VPRNDQLGLRLTDKANMSIEDSQINRVQVWYNVALTAAMMAMCTCHVDCRAEMSWRPASRALIVVRWGPMLKVEAATAGGLSVAGTMNICFQCYCNLRIAYR
jgi:hypothetical protein